MAYLHVRSPRSDTQGSTPLARELGAIFDALPDSDLLNRLQGPKRRGPRGYDSSILWHSYIAYYFMGLPSVSDLIRALHDNPSLAEACGIESPDMIPSQPTFSRFFTKLSKQVFKGLVNQVFHSITRELWQTLPDFGQSVAIDATDLRAWSNGAHRKPTDKNAGWVIKADTNGRGKFTWGYKCSILVDTTYELPIAVKVTSGNTHDTKAVSPLLRHARWVNQRFRPQYVIMDSGYSSEPLRKLIRKQYRSTPIIQVNPSHKKAKEKYPETPEWKMIYNRRTGVERIFGRLKGHRKLNSIRVRGIHKVHMHCLMAMLVLQAQALVTGTRTSVRKVV